MLNYIKNNIWFDVTTTNYFFFSPLYFFYPCFEPVNPSLVSHTRPLAVWICRVRNTLCREDETRQSFPLCRTYRWGRHPLACVHTAPWLAAETAPEWPHVTSVPLRDWRDAFLMCHSAFILAIFLSPAAHHNLQTNAASTSLASLFLLCFLRLFFFFFLSLSRSTPPSTPSACAPPSPFT